MACHAAGVRPGPALNLHKAVGNDCDWPAGGERLLESEALQRRFIDLWHARTRQKTSRAGQRFRKRI